MKPLSHIFLLVILALSGCSSVSFSHKKSSFTKALSDTDRQNLVTHAQNALGQSQIKVGKKSFRADCSGSIRAFFAQSRIKLGGVLKTKDDNDVKAIYRYVRKYGKVLKSDPEPGDLVFFHNTYDRNRNGRMDNALTHIGLVEKVENRTVYFIHHLGQSIIRSRMNLFSPKDAVDPKSGQRINHILRNAQGGFPAYSAAELFAGFGRL